MPFKLHGVDLDLGLPLQLTCLPRDHKIVVKLLARAVTSEAPVGARLLLSALRRQHFRQQLAAHGSSLASQVDEQRFSRERFKVQRLAAFANLDRNSTEAVDRKWFYSWLHGKYL